MNYGEILQRIKMQIHHYECKYGETPNRIILGIDVFLFLTAYETYIVRIGHLDGPTTIFDIPIAKSLTNSHEISVGYVEEINISQ